MEYLLKSSACLIGFYCLYFFIFRKFTFHSLNRYYLLASLVFSTVIPLLTFEKEIIQYNGLQSVIENLPTVETFENVSSQQTTFEKRTPKILFPSPIQILWYLYIIGIVVFLFLFLKNILKIVLLISKMPFERMGNLKLYDATSQFSNASFFNNLFIDSFNLNPHEKTLVIKHEELHFQKLHTVDLLISGLYKVFFWFNPVAYFIQNSLKEIHEFEIDEAIAKTHNPKEYATLLLKLCVSNRLELVNQIGKLPLTERINFLFTKPTTKMKKSLYLASIPVVVMSIMAFAKKKTVTIFEDKNNATTITKIAVKTYPLTLKTDKNYATWGFSKSLQMSPSNISLNNLTTVNANGYHYEINPNSLTENTIERVNIELKKRNLALIITEKETDLDGSFSKLGLAIKHLKTKEITQSENFDMTDYRKKGETGAFFIIEAYDKNFKNSQITFIFGTKDLLINKSNLPKNKHHTFSINSGSSIINHSSDVINYTVYPDKLTLKAAEEAKTYFLENGLDFELKKSKTNSDGTLETANVLFGNQTQAFNLRKMRHWIKLKTEVNTKPYRMDESIIFEANLITKETKISINNFWFRAIEKSGKYEILSNYPKYNEDNLRPQKEIRTVYETNFLGENPLVIINGEEFPAEILTKLNSKAFGWSLIYMPNNEKAITKYGEKAKDGYFEMRSINDYVFTNEKELSIAREIVKKHLNADKKRVLRINYEDADGKKFEKIIIHKEDKTSTHLSMDVPHNSKILFMIDKKIVSENDIENTQLKIIGGSCTGKIEEADIKHYGAVLKDYNGYFNLTTKKF